MKRMCKATILVKYNRPGDTYRLRDLAHDAFMNGLTANAKEYNRRADILDRELRDLAARTWFNQDKAEKANAEDVLRHELAND
jgi:hypothetical protein